MEITKIDGLFVDKYLYKNILYKLLIKIIAKNMELLISNTKNILKNKSEFSLKSNVRIFKDNRLKKYNHYSREEEDKQKKFILSNFFLYKNKKQHQYILDIIHKQYIEIYEILHKLLN